MNARQHTPRCEAADRALIEAGRTCVVAYRDGAQAHRDFLAADGAIVAHLSIAPKVRDVALAAAWVRARDARNVTRDRLDEAKRFCELAWIELESARAECGCDAL